MSLTSQEIALNGKTPEVRAKVLEIALKAGFDADEPIWWVFVALGSFESLVVELPGELEKLLKQAQEEGEKTRKENIELALSVKRLKVEVEQLVNRTQTLASSQEELTKISRQSSVEIAQGAKLLNQTTWYSIIAQFVFCLVFSGVIGGFVWLSLTNSDQYRTGAQCLSGKLACKPAPKK